MGDNQKEIGNYSLLNVSVMGDKNGFRFSVYLGFRHLLTFYIYRWLQRIITEFEE
jgi:hypothetical protein